MGAWVHGCMGGSAFEARLCLYGWFIRVHFNHSRRYPDKEDTRSSAPTTAELVSDLSHGLLLYANAWAKRIPMCTDMCSFYTDTLIWIFVRVLECLLSVIATILLYLWAWPRIIRALGNQRRLRSHAADEEIDSDRTRLSDPCVQ